MKHLRDVAIFAAFGVVSVAAASVIAVPMLRMSRAEDSSHSAHAGSSRPRPVFVVHAIHEPALNRTELGVENRSLATIDELFVEAQLLGPDGRSETRQFMFKYVDPGKAVWDDTPWNKVWSPNTVVVRSVAMCKVEGAYVDDCGSYLSPDFSSFGLPVKINTSH